MVAYSSFTQGLGSCSRVRDAWPCLLSEKHHVTFLLCFASPSDLAFTITAQERLWNDEVSPLCGYQSVRVIKQYS